MFRYLPIVIFALFSFSDPTFAAPGKRVALVIGNSAYQYASELPNPRNDAADIAEVFEQLGFEVVKGHDLTKSGMDKTIRSFADALEGADVAVFFYAGHGLQHAGLNYLVPTDAKAETNSALDFEMVQLSLVQRTMVNAAKTSVIFLDACRNNPLTKSLARALGHRSIGLSRGLAKVDAGYGTLISFATAPGDVALDGKGRNSPYTAALKKHLIEPRLDLPSTLIKVRVAVARATNNAQIPWEQSALMGQLYLSDKRNAPVEATASSVAPEQEATIAWDFVKDSVNIDTLRAFSKRFKNTEFAALANDRLARLEQQATEAKLEKQRLLARKSHRPSPKGAAAACTNKQGIDYCVSSYLPTQGINRSQYGPSSLSDSNDKTAWVEGRSGRSDLGIGEWILLDWGVERRLSGITLRNGYAKSKSIYNKNALVARIKVTLSNGQSFSASIDDNSSLQSIVLPKISAATWMRAQIEDAKMGSKYADTAINEIRAIFE